MKKLVIISVTCTVWLAAFLILIAAIVITCYRRSKLRQKMANRATELQNTLPLSDISERASAQHGASSNLQNTQAGLSHSPQDAQPYLEFPANYLSTQQNPSLLDNSLINEVHQGRPNNPFPLTPSAPPVSEIDGCISGRAGCYTVDGHERYATTIGGAHPANSTTGANFQHDPMVYFGGRNSHGNMDLTLPSYDPEWNSEDQPPPPYPGIIV